MADDKIRMPSGQGGLTRFYDESVSRIQLSPGTIVVLCLLVMVIIVLLHALGGRFS